ncbi:helix-turn-helix transcriptional regulator [Amycolatopsis sp. NPDC005232]|uniref:AraC family transcriptional regulator n=1 Tax=Amycolatopsis sp. NPDC005232 TaxID=3157027 RepID=UPI0033B40638
MPVLETSEPDEAVDLLTGVYCPHRMLLGAGAPGFHMRQEERLVRGIRMMKLTYGDEDVGVEPVPFDDFVLVMRPLAGRLSASRQGDVPVQTRRHALAFDGRSRYRLRWHERCQVGNVVIDLPHFERAVADLHGTPDVRSVRIDIAEPASDIAAERWTAVEALLWRELGRVEPPPPLVHGQLVRLAVASILENFATTFTLDDGRLHATGSQAAVRRAVAFIENSAAEDVGLTRIAEAAGLSARGLQQAFRRHLDTTPLAYLRRVRLDHAHRELLASSPAATTVSRIATRWGFANPGRFAAEHRREFGSEPKDVLRS